MTSHEQNRVPTEVARRRPARRGLGQRARRLLFGISPEETSFDRRGFEPAAPTVRRRLEQIGRTFVEGYLAALDESDPVILGERLNEIERERRGWAFEGSAMALALLDQLTPWKRNRVERFLDGPAQAHIYLVHVGMGWALARLGRRINRPPRRLDGLLRWLVVDGYGFHEGFFHWRRTIKDRRRPPRVFGYARRAFDQGLGRCVWFVMGADVGRIVDAIGAFAIERRADLWSGVGLACAYVGGVEDQAIDDLRIAAEADHAWLAQGAAFAAKARERARNEAPHTETACRILCGLSAAAAAQCTDRALKGLPADFHHTPAYEAWRRRLHRTFETKVVMA